MRITRLAIPLTMTALALTGAGSASASPVIPPGSSGANQYTETLPEAGGNHPTGTLGGSHPKAPTKALGKEAAEDLEALGPEGRAAASLAAAGAPSSELVKAGSEVRRGGAQNGGAGGFSQILGHLTGATDSGGGMGAWLLVLIAGAVVASGAYAVSRRQTPE